MVPVRAWRTNLKLSLAATKALKIAGMRSLDFHADLGVRDGNAEYAVVAEFDDVDAYRRYDADPEHDRIRREIALPLVASIERCLYRI